MPLQLDSNLDPLVGVISILLRTERDSTSSLAMRAWNKKVLKAACREIEEFITPRVSVAAAERAASLGLEDLRTLRWTDQPRRMRDPGREIFHWEHMVPVAQLKAHLSQVDPLDLAAIETVLRTVDVAWILKSENERLSKKGFSSRRPDPQSAYESCNITLVDCH